MVRFLLTLPSSSVALAVLLLIGSGCQSTHVPTASACPVSTGPFTAPVYAIEEVDTLAQPIGGLRAMQQRIVYPRSALRDRVQGEVVVQFIVDDQGCVVAPVVLEPVDDRLDAEALRVIQATRFEPAQLDGQAVAIRLSLPIGFYMRARR